MSGVGTGLCLGTPPASHEHLCSLTKFSPKTSATFYLVPGPNRWWACNTGLTPCVSTSVFDPNVDFCVMVQLIPRIHYYTANNFEDHFDNGPKRYKREPLSITLAILLGVGVDAGIGTGATTLVTGQQGLNALFTTIDEDLKMLEQSITNLERSLISLSEVVLQNRKGLDLLFL